MTLATMDRLYDVMTQTELMLEGSQWLHRSGI